MMEIMRREASVCSLHELVNKLIPEVIAKQIKKSCIGIYPIDNVFIQKVKLLKAAKFDSNKFAEIHSGAAAEDTGKAVEAPAEAEATEKPAEEAAAEKK